MKKLILSLIISFIGLTNLFAGGGGGGTVVPCSDANPFCTEISYNFENSTNTSAPSGPNYGCLGSQPNPIWYYMQVSTPGSFQIGLSQTTGPNGTGSGIDVDFAMWGPFTSLTAGCNSVMAGAAPIQCSFSASATETIGIGLPGGTGSGASTPPAATAGSVYIVLLTNYSGSSGYISFNQTGGTGVADCSIVTPCDITNLTVTPGACNPATNTFNLTGSVTFVDAPTTGTLTVTSSCGGTQTFNAPFTSPTNYTLSNLPSNGAACTVTATFSADNTCTRTSNFTAPPSCLPCNMTGITTNVGACNPANNQYAVSGNVSFTNPPSTGTLTITNSCGGTQTFNAPFTSPAAYNFTGLTSNGGACTITATFSANAACTISQNYTAPANCIPPCLITNLTANIGTCQTNNTFPVSGTFTYDNNPGTGTVTVTVTNGSGSQTQTFNPPFVNGQTYNYNITTNNSDGTPLTVTVTFSNAPACTMSLNSTSPPNCQCPADIGTFTATITGVSTTNYVLCYGDEINIIANGDYTPGNEATAPPNAGGYEPGITWLVYSCPPTIALTPSNTPPNDWIGNDPCLLGLYSDFDLIDLNDQFWMTAFPPGTFTNNTVYFVPITMYNLTESLYSYVNTSLPCYEMGTPYAVQYLPEITFTQSQNCANVSVTINGGLPAVNGSQFTVVAGSLSPANASFVNTSASNGGTISVTGLNPGQAYSYQVQDGNGCPITVSGTFTGAPTLSYPQSSYCPVGTTSPTITGPTGGTFSSTAGLSINPTTGVIDLAASTPGSYVVTYSTPAVPGPVCTATFNITVFTPSPVNAGPDQSVCFGASVTLSATGSSSYTWSGGVQNNVSFVPQTTQTYTVAGTDSNGCISSDDVLVTVNNLPQINAGPDQSICQGQSVTLTATGGSTYSWSGGVVNGVSFVPPVGSNSYTVTGTSAEGCVATDEVIVVVNPTPTVFAGIDVVVCEGQSVTLTGSGAATYSWDSGVTNGVAFVPAVGTITYTVTGTTAAGCINTDQVNVTVNSNPEISFFPGATLGCAPFSTTLTNTSTNSANCTWTLSNGMTFNGCGTIPVTFTQAGCYNVTLTTTSTAGCTSSFTANNVICVEAPPVAGFAPSSNQLSTLNTEVLFMNNSTGASNYLWSFGDGSQYSTEVNPTHVYPIDPVGTYEVMLIAYSPLGCTDTAYSTIQIYEELIFYVPNTFTPDIDNYNPVFLPVFTSGFDPYNYNLKIFNRWGEIIFESNNHLVGWDGSYGKNGEIELCQDGTYTWKIEFKVNRWDERRIAVGHVNLIR